MAPTLGIFSVYRGGNLKEKIGNAIRQVEIQRRELERLRFRLDERRTSIFRATVRAFEESEETRAKVLSQEHRELQKIVRTVNASEIALLQITVRLETLKDVGEVMHVLSSAFRAVKKIGRSMSELVPNLERMTLEINSSFSEILSELGVSTPSIGSGLRENPHDIFEKAQELISKRAMELAGLPKSAQSMGGDNSIEEGSAEVALLATEDELSQGESSDTEFRPVLLRYSSKMMKDAESAVRNYASERESQKFELLSCSAQLNLPVDLVEQAYIKLLSETRFNDAMSKRTRDAGNSTSS